MQDRRRYATRRSSMNEVFNAVVRARLDIEREGVTPLCVDNKIYEPLILEAKEEEK
jgi:hypothetical protein